MFRDEENVEVVLGEVEEFDLERRSVKFRAEGETDIPYDTLVVGGPTGVELAGQIALLAHRVLRGEYRHIDPSTTRVILLDAVPSVLEGFPASVGERATRPSCGRPV
jgi:NADH dehydrogenase FAD-containing subunit